VAAAVLGGQELGQMAAQGAQLAVAGWGRGQELEADQLGIRYMANVGYDPREMPTFLDSMGRHAQLQALLAGRPGAADGFSYLQTHPPTGERVQRANTAVAERPGADWRVERDGYLRRLDGMVYGDNPANGFVRDRVFAHPSLGFRFQVPPGFRLLNGAQQVTAIGPTPETLMIFDGARAKAARDPADYLVTEWAGPGRVQGVGRIDINGMPAATGTARLDTRAGPVDARLVAIAWEGVSSTASCSCPRRDAPPPSTPVSGRRRRVSAPSPRRSGSICAPIGSEWCRSAQGRRRRISLPACPMATMPRNGSGS
jgi:predicted Zn-dependent protease